MELNLNNKMVSIEQMIIFINIIETGSFLATSKKLQRAQSAISYNINNMEYLLGYKLFDRTEKKPKLTEKGKAFAIEVRPLLHNLQNIMAHSDSMKEGLEPSISITFDIIFPLSEQVKLIQKFKKEFPSVAINTRTGILKDCTDDLIKNNSVISIIGIPNFSNEYLFLPCGQVEFMPVASKDHPLANVQKTTDEELLEYTQILLSDKRVDEKVPTNFKTYSNLLRVNDVRTRNYYLNAGFGWARSPKHQIQEYLESGELIPILKKQWNRHHLKAPLFISYHKAATQGPAFKWWIRELSKYRNKSF